MKPVMRTYKKKPVQVQAVEWNGDDNVYKYLEYWSAGMVRKYTRNILLVQSPQGAVDVNIGDFVVRGIGGEFYPVGADIFNAEYELVGWEQQRDSDMWPEVNSVNNKRNQKL